MLMLVMARRVLESSLCVALWLTVLTAQLAFAQSPPVLNTVFPMGGQRGQAVEVTVSGGNFQSLRTLHCNVPGVRCEKLDASRFRVSIPAETPPGFCDLWAVGENGVSAPRTFLIGNREEHIEVEPKAPSTDSMPVAVDCVINGRIEKGGDADLFRFDAKAGQRVIVECFAERIDSRLRAVLEIFDATGRRLAVNRGYFGIDPLIDFRVPLDGAYVVKIQDLTLSGSAEHYYRLDIDTKPRVAFTVPSVVQRGKSARVALYGWNLAPTTAIPGEFERVDIELPVTLTEANWPMPVRLLPAQAALEGFAYHLPGSNASVVIGLTDAPVVLDRGDNHGPQSAQAISVPSEVSGQLAASDERDWFAIEARRGEVFFIEGIGQRMQSPVDLQISVFDKSGQSELSQFSDEVRNIGGTFPTSHLDPAGRWVCPADGRYFIAIRSLIGGVAADARRLYRLSVRREEPEFQVVAVPRRDDAAGLNVRRGGREVLDVFALRRRGCDGVIRITALELPQGVECPDVWLGPGVDHATLVVSADQNAAAQFTALQLSASVDQHGVAIRRNVRGGTIVRTGTPNGWGRLTSQIPMAIGGDAPLRITADAHEPIEHHLYGKLTAKHAPGSFVDVAVEIERRDSAHQAAVKLIGIGLPNEIRNATAVIPPGKTKGFLSFYLPPTLPVGRYSWAVRAESTVPLANQKTEAVAVVSNSVTIDVNPAAMLVEVDPFTVTQVKRGETIKVSYSAKRLNGFIGKMHTELAAPGVVTNVIGLRGRGETFTGQTEKGTLQIVINDDAPIGRQQFLRLFTVGVVEDEPTYFGSGVFPLEIVE